MNTVANRFEFLKWLAVLPALLAAPFLFFGIAWIAAVQFTVGCALAGSACLIWRSTSGSWPFSQVSR